MSSFLSKLYPSLTLSLLWISPVLAQDRTLSGKVTATDGSLLPGVNVVVKGFVSGGVSDANGSYSIRVPASAPTLVFSFIGYLTQEVNIPPSSDLLNATLVEDVQNLEEVIVTGLATSIKRSNAANAVTRLSADELVGATRPATLDAAMSGKLIGANIQQNNGAPGGGVSIKLRGISSINGTSEPLYVIDGVFANNAQFANGAGAGPFTGAGAGQDQAPNRISDLNPADVESIDVLKGPSAAAIYGTRANAGVVIITTKRGKAGKTRVSFGQDVGFASAIRLQGSSNWSLDPVGPEGQNKFDYVFGNGQPGSGNPAEVALWQEASSEGKIYDYEKIIYGHVGVISNTRLSVSGGNEKTRFYLAAGRNDETGIQQKTGFQRNSIRVNIDHQLAKWIDVSVGSNYLRTGAQRSFSGNDNRGVSIGYSLAYTPNYAQLFPVNGVYPNSRYTGDNPLAIADRTINDEQTNRFVQSFSSNIYFLQQPNRTLKLALAGGVDYLNTEGEVYFPEDLQSQRQRATPGASRFSKSRSANTNLQAFLIYNWKIGGKVDLTSQAGTVRLVTDNDLSYIQGEGLLPGQKNPNNAGVRTASETFQSWQDVGLVAQQEANFEDKIIGTLGIRFDKSSLNGNHQQWYPFPRASLAVNVANFGFWSFAPVNQLKLRGAYGQTGGVPVFGNTFTPLVTTLIDGRLLGTQAPATVGNPNIEPETAQEVELGVDVGLWRNKVTLEATIYDKTVFNLLNPYTLSSGSGVTQYNAYPVGDLQNRGVELGIGFTPVERTRFAWTAQVQYWANRSKITRLEIPNTVVGPGFAWARNQLRLGESPNRWYGTPNVPDADGIVQATGYETSQPRYQISFSNQFRFFKNFEFSFLLHTSQGNFNGNVTTRHKDTGGTSVDWSSVENLWETVGVPNGMARRASNPNVTTRMYIQDASYVRLRETALYYTVPAAFLSSLFGKVVSSVRIGASAVNLLTFTDYQGYDPEVSNFGNQSVGSNVDNAVFPNSKRIFFHLAVDF
ncbi:MAG: SusC/RagA family TonB-linked outer membrane protein [Ferruginibacter sp.]|nr:SusC/RagA family TonB-linked outer membrane protein [Cytophagales bacterium]